MKFKFRDFLLGGSCLAAGYIAAGMSAAAKEKELKEEWEPGERAKKIISDSEQIDKASPGTVELSREEYNDLFNQYNSLLRTRRENDIRVAELTAANAQERAKNAALQNDVKKLKEKQERLNFVIDQCDGNGEILSTFKTFEEASKESGVPEKSIKKCVMCVQKTAGGFVWKVDFLSDKKVEN